MLIIFKILFVILILLLKYVNLCSINACDALQICTEDIDDIKNKIAAETDLETLAIRLRNIDRRLRAVEQPCMHNIFILFIYYSIFKFYSFFHYLLFLILLLEILLNNISFVFHFFL